MPDRSIWLCPSRYRRLSTASVASLLRQNSEPAIADNALFQRLFRASQVYICRKTFGYLLSHSVDGVAGDFRFGSLIGQSPGMKTPADDGLVAIHRRLDEAPPAISRATLPSNAAV